MLENGINEKDIKIFFFDQSKSPSNKGTNIAVISNNNDKYRKYEPMRKMHMPEGAIRQKMMIDGVTEAELDVFFSNKTSDNDGAGALHATLAMFKKKVDSLKELLKLLVFVNPTGLSWES